ncbi:MAG: hypothetical protein WB999_09315 [Candidatus Binataceae bacterium]
MFDPSNRSILATKMASVFPTIVKDTSKFLREQEATSVPGEQEATSVPGRLRMAGKIKAPAAVYADAESEELAR